MKRLPTALIVTAALAASTLACGGPRDRTERRTIIDSRDETDPRSLDPALSTDVPTGRAVGYVFDGLTRFTPDAQVIPGLAERWDVSPDGRRYTFHLRRGVRFHDGTPFVARHVVSSWQRALDPKTRGGRAEPLEPILGARDFAAGKATSVAGLAAPDDSTVVVTLNDPLAIFTKLLAMPVAAIVPENRGADFDRRPIGTGPWKLVEWRQDDYLLFARNDDYWGGPPAQDSLRARILGDMSTAIAEFESGNVDLVRIPASETPYWETDERRKVLLHRTNALQLVYVAINTTRGPLRDARVRQALNHAIDIPTILERLGSGRGTLAAGVIPPSLGGFAERPRYAFDPARARQLLAEAGFPDGIDVELWVSQSGQYVRAAETMQAYLNAVGVRTKLVMRESAAARQAARGGQADLYLKDWYADYPDAENFLFPLLHGTTHGVGGNVSFFTHPDYDRIVTAARTEQDQAKREALYRQADSLQFTQAPMIYLWFFADLFAVQPWIEGFRPPVIFNGQPWHDVRIRNPAPQP